jgi:predicted peptidase
MMIREQGPLPFIIVAPLLSGSEFYRSFPESYMDGVLEQVLADYRVDQKRIYVTGLSMGGEATYRFALHRPDTFAAVVPLAAFLNSPPSMESIKALPVWAIHGADDTVVSLSAAQQPVDALEQAGGNVRFTILEGHDHDVWTDTYSDPLFYDWLLQHQRP